jgi:hypothetical protein
MWFSLASLADSTRRVNSALGRCDCVLVKLNMESMILTIGILASLMALALVKNGSLIKDRISYKKAWLHLCLSVVVHVARAVIGAIIAIASGGKSVAERVSVADGASVVNSLASGVTYLLLALSLWYLSQACFEEDAGNENQKGLFH